MESGGRRAAAVVDVDALDRGHALGFRDFDQPGLEEPGRGEVHRRGGGEPRGVEADGAALRPLALLFLAALLFVLGAALLAHRLRGLTVERHRTARVPRQDGVEPDHLEGEEGYAKGPPAHGGSEYTVIPPAGGNSKQDP